MDSTHGNVNGKDGIPEPPEEELKMNCPDSGCEKKLDISKMLEHAVKVHHVPVIDGTEFAVEVEFSGDPPQSRSDMVYKRKVWMCAVIKGYDHEFLVAIETNCRSISLVKIFPIVLTYPVSKKFCLGLKFQGEDGMIDFAAWHKCISATESMASAFINGDFMMLHENHLKAFGKKTGRGGTKCIFNFQVLAHGCPCKVDVDANSNLTLNVAPKPEESQSPAVLNGNSAETECEIKIVDIETLKEVEEADVSVGTVVNESTDLKPEADDAEASIECVAELDESAKLKLEEDLLLKELLYIVP